MSAGSRFDEQVDRYWVIAYKCEHHSFDVVGRQELFGALDGFDYVRSIVAVGLVEPGLQPCRHAVDVVGSEPGDAAMVAVHVRDLVGAAAVGMETAFVARPGATSSPNAERAGLVVGNVIEGINRLTKDPMS